jgi:hypothetical protein
VLVGLGDARVLTDTCVNIEIEVDGICKLVKFFIVDKCVRNVEVLLGQNFTELPDIEYAKSSGVFKFSQKGCYNVLVVDKTVVQVGLNDPKIVNDLLQLLNKFPMCVSRGMSEVGCVTSVAMKIELTTTQPISCRPRRHSDVENEEIREIVSELIRNGIVKESNSPYSSQVSLVTKKGNGKRLVVDYRALNKITIKDNYPLPLIEDLVNRLAGYKYYIILDLFSGYYQIPMSEESIPYTSFVTQDGQYEFLRMPFGLCNAPAVFQRMINTALGQLRFTKVCVYMDDILIPGKTPQDCLAVLQEVLQILRVNGLTLKLSKCHFLKTEIEYLGYIISESKVQPSNYKVAAVEKFPIPQNIHQVRQFLGLTGYFRKFVQGYANKAKPLSLLLHKDSEWRWGAEQEASFNFLKESLIRKPILTIFNPKLPIKLYTDASRLGIGGILIQSENGKEKVVAYYSRQTSIAEQKYHSFELETLAIVASIQRFRRFLLGRPFTVITDCNSVKNTFSKKEVNARIASWVLQLGEYDLTIVHKSSQQMQHVDALSRNPQVSEQSVRVAMISAEDWLFAAQQSDRSITEIRQILESGDRKGNKSIFNDYILKTGRVYRITPFGLRWVVPKYCRFQILKLSHDDVGHFGFDKTFELINEKYWFPKMRRFTKKYVDNCLNCLYLKSNSSQKSGFLHPIKKIPKPFHTIHIDHLGPFIRSKSGKTQVFTVIDAFTKFIFLYAVKSTKAMYAIQCLKEIIKNFGVPHRIISDQGSAFTSKEFRNFTAKYSITHHFNAVALPKGNGQVERYNKVVLHSLSTMGANTDDKRWDDNLINVQLGINGTFNKAIGATPSEALMGYRVVCHGLLDAGESSMVDVTEIRDRMVKGAERYQAEMKRRYDEARLPSKVYAVGDFVLLRITSNVATGQSHKLLPKWRGPFKVTRVLGNDRYVVEDIPGSKRSRLKYQSTAGAENMKPWIAFSI